MSGQLTTAVRGSLTRRRRVAVQALVLGAVLVLVLVLAVAAGGLRLVTVTSDSMTPYAGTGSRMLTWPLRGAPEAGDVVLLRPPESWREAYRRQRSQRSADDLDLMVKRVIGLPGDQVECCAAGGGLLVNGTALAEEYLLVDPRVANNPTFRVVVPPGHVWVMGDNRPASFDSRSAHALTGDGFVPLDRLTARPWLLW